MSEQNEEDVRFWKGQMEAHAEMAWYYDDAGNPHDWKSRAERAEAQLAEARGALEEASYYISGRLTGDPELMPDTLFAKIVAALPAEQGEE